MLEQKNKEVREAIRNSGLKFWEVAEMLGIADATFSRKLRTEMPITEKNKILSLLGDLDNVNDLGERLQIEKLKDIIKEKNSELIKFKNLYENQKRENEKLKKQVVSARNIIYDYQEKNIY